MTKLEEMFDFEHGILRPGRHFASWDEINELFVLNAPHTSHREKLLSMAKIWVTEVQKLSPSATIWLDGGFVSHKSAKPSDIDISAFIEKTRFAELSEDELFPLLTRKGKTGKRVKPSTFEQLIDGFIFENTKTNQQVWYRWWQNFEDPQKKDSYSPFTKGFIEVLS